MNGISVSLVVRQLVETFCGVVVADKKDVVLDLHVKNRSVQMVVFSCCR